MKANPLKGCVLLLCIGILLPAAATFHALVPDDLETASVCKPIPSVDRSIVSCTGDGSPVTIHPPHKISVPGIPQHIVVHF